MMNLYAKVYATFILPVTLGLLFTMLSINSLLKKQQDMVYNKEQLEITYIQQRFVQILNTLQRDINIISKSNEIEQALIINDNNTLIQWGESFLNTTYSTIMFINANHTILARAHDPFYFGDKFNKSLIQKLQTADYYQGIHIIDEKEQLIYVKKIKDFNTNTVGYVLLGITLNESFLKNISDNNHFIIQYNSLLHGTIYSKNIHNSVLQVPLKSYWKNIDKEARFFIQTQKNNEIEEIKSFKFNILSFTVLISVAILILLYVILRSFLRPYKKLYLLLLDFVDNKIDFNHLKFASKEISENTKAKEIFHMSRAINRVSKKALKNENELKRISNTDQLTKILNRRKLDEILMKESFEAHRYQKKLSIVLIDIDYFKNINDTHGHTIGDKVLKQFSNKISQQLRTCDAFGRWGGEEFLIICPSTNLEGAIGLTKKIQHIIKSDSFVNDIQVTASFGIGEIMQNESFYNLISRTDEALYKAKNSGRDRIETANESPIKSSDSTTNQ